MRENRFRLGAPVTTNRPPAQIAVERMTNTAARAPVLEAVRKKLIAP